MATAPTVRAWPDICIGDIESASPSATQGNVFVFEDAFDVRDNFVSDDIETSISVKWSFLQIGGGGEILINGQVSLTGTGGDPGDPDDPINPDANRSITAANTDTAIGANLNLGPGAVEDGNEFTLTFRNADLSPLPSGPYPDPPGATGDPNQEVDTTVLTVFASDMTTASFFDVIVATYNQGTDTLSGITFEEKDFFDFTTSVFGWTSGGLSGGATAAGPTANGLCITVPDGGTGPLNNSPSTGQWFSPFANPIIELASETLYLLRMTLFTDVDTDANPNMIPLVFFGLFDLSGTSGADAFILGSGGGANAIGATNGIDVHQLFWAPMAVRIGGATGWSTTAFTPTADAVNDMLMTFSLFNTAAGIAFWDDGGTVCLTDLTILCGNINDLSGAAAFDEVPSASTFAAGVVIDSTNAADDALPDSATFSGQGATFVVGDVVGPNSQNLPGQPAAGVGFLSFAGTTIPEQYPLAWNDGELLEMQLTASSTSGGSDPVNIMSNVWLSFPTELGGTTFVSGGPLATFGSGGSPVVGSDRVWSHFMYSSNATLNSSFPDPNNGLQIVPSAVNKSNVGGTGTGADPVLFSRVAVYAYQVD